MFAVKLVSGLARSPLPPCSSFKKLDPFSLSLSLSFCFLVSPFLLVSLPSFRHACPSTLFRFYLWAAPASDVATYRHQTAMLFFLAEYIRLSFRFSLVLEVMEGWRTRRGIYRRINCNSRAMCCGKSRLEGLETKETLLFNVDKLDRLYLNFRFQEIWKEFSRCSY